MRILITGADGQLGWELQQVLAGEDLQLFLWPEFDLLKPDVKGKVQAAKPDVVVHAAAYTNVDQAEREPEVAWAVNATGTDQVAQGAAACGARLIYVSTDYVFDGQKRAPYRESDATNPINAYGRSKLEGERLALAFCPNTLVVRSAWLYGVHGQNFVKTIRELAMKQKVLRVVSDQRGCPTYAADLAKALAALLKQDIRGILHAAGSGDCTWYDFACRIVSDMGGAIPIVPITTAESNRLAARPQYAVLSNEKLKELEIYLPHWTEGLTRFMEASLRESAREASKAPA